MEIDEPRCFGSGENKKVVHKVDKVLLDLFWKLAEGNDNERVKAAETLVNRLAENKKQDAEGHASQEKYCLQRLVRGMASSRKFARVGYAVTLTKLLRETKDIKVKNVLEVIAEELKVSAHDPKTEVGNKLLGRVFAYGAVIQSERKVKGKQLGTVVRELLTVGSKKSHIRPTVTQTLMDLIGCLTLEVFSETVWPVLKEDLDKGWEECTPDRLIFLLACRNKDKSLVDKAYLKAHWGAAKILGKKNYEHILQLFRRSVETPQLQQMMLEMVAKEMTRKVDDMDDLKDFWTKVGNPLLASTVPRKQVALSLFCHLLEQTSDPTLAESMLFPAAAAVICRAYDRKDDPLFDVCRRAESLLVGACRDQEKSGAVLSMVTKFIQTCHRLKYHDFLRSNTLSTLASSLQGESVKEFCEMCMDCMMGRGDLVQQDDDKEDSAKHRDQFSQQLVPLLRVAAVNPTVQQSVPLTILQFLLLHTFFKVIKATKDIPHCQEVGPNFSPALRNKCQAMFYRTLTQLLSMRPDRQNPDQQLLTYIRVLSDLAHFTQELLSSADTVQPVKAFAPELQEEWQKIMKIISNSKPNQKRKSTSGQVGEAETFTLLILHLAFDLFKDPEATMEVLQDIYICHQKAAKKQKAKQAEDGEPEWMEVMTEILLSMLSRPSKLARKTAVAVFGMLSSHVTPAALHLITQVLKEDKSKKDDLFEFEDIKEEINGEADDDDDDKNSEEENDDDDDCDGKEEVMPADEDSSEDDSDDDDAEVDDELRRSVKAALGPAAAGSDEEEEEDDLSDSEMFKLDDQLAAAFRSIKRPTRKEKKEKQKEVAKFRLRTLDLLEVIVKGDRCGDFALEILEPLMRLVVLKFRGQQGEGQQLCNRATLVFNLLCKQRNLVDHIHSQEEMMEVTHNLLQLAQSGSNPQLAGHMANGCLCIMRLMSAQPDSSEASPVKTRAMREDVKKEAPPTSHDGQAVFVKAVQDALEEDLLKRNNPKYNMAFFSAMILKYPSVFWPFLTTVVKVFQSEQTKVHTKTQTCALLVHLLNCNKRASLSEAEWNIFAPVLPILKKMVLSQRKGSIKSRLLVEVLSALIHVTQLTTVEQRKTVLTGEVFQHLALLKPAFNKDVRRLHFALKQLLARPDKDKAGKKRKQEDGENAAQNGTPGKKRKKQKQNAGVLNGD